MEEEKTVGLEAVEPTEKKRQPWKGILAAVLLAAVLIAGGLLYPKLKEKVASQEEPPTVNYSADASADSSEGLAPDFVVQSSDGTDATLSERRGKIVVLNFWASWCRPCGRELPAFEEAYQRYGDQVEFMMINLTQIEQSVEDVKALIERGELTFPVFFDTDGSAAESYGIQSIPVTVFIWPDGTVYQQRIGQMNEDTLNRYIETMRATVG